MGRRRALAIGAGLILAGSVLIAGCSDGSAGPTTTATTSAPTSAPTAPTTTPPPPSPPTTLPADAFEVMATTIAANSAVVAGGSLWVAGTDDPDQTGGHALLRIDPMTAEVTSSIDVGGSPLLLESVDDLLWVATSEGLARVDMASEEVDAVELGGPGRALAASAGTVWVEVDRSGELDSEITAVDASSLEARPIGVSDASFGVILDLETDGETLWASIDDRFGQTVIALDATTDEPVEGFDDPWADDEAQALELELVGGELWICGLLLDCLIVDPATGGVVREASLTHPEGELTDLVTGEGSLWAAVAVGTDDGEDGDVTDDRSSAFIRVDPASGSELGPLYEAAYPVPSLAVGDGTAFLVAPANESRFDRELIRIALDR